MISTYSDGNGTALAGLLNGDGVRLTKVGAPVTSTDRNDGKLGNDDGGADGGSDFLGGLDTETDVTLGVTDNDDSLEAGTLTGTGLLLDGLDLWWKKRQDVSKTFVLMQKPCCSHVSIAIQLCSCLLPCVPSLFAT